MIAAARPLAAFVRSIATSCRKRFARSDCTRISPARGARPFGRNTRALEGLERDARCHTGIDRVPALREDRGASLRGEVMAGAHHPALREHRGSTLGDAAGRRGVLDRDLAHPETRYFARWSASSRGAYR